MARGNRHSAPASRALDRSYRRAIKRSNLREEYYPTSPQGSPLSPPRAPEHTARDYTAGLWLPLESSVVHQLLRESPLFGRPEWGQSRPVADQRRGPSLGGLMVTDAILAIQRGSGVSNLGRRS